MIKATCIVCKKELDKAGALFLSSPDKIGQVVKSHLCINCEGYFSGVLMEAQRKKLGRST